MVKGAAALIVSMGAGVIVGNVAVFTTPATAGKLQKFLISAGAFGVGGAIGDAAAKYTTDLIDEIIDGKPEIAVVTDIR